MKKLGKITLLFMLFVITLTIRNNIKAATFGHYTYRENSDGTIEITKYDNTSSDNLVIPSIIDGKSVTSIGENAFENCKGLTGSLTIPDSVIYIGINAFEGCSGLTGSLTIPNSVTTIGWKAFEGCSGLTNITIGNNVISIRQRTFCDCSSLTNITIPDGVTSIGDETFKGCNSLTNITIPNSVTSIKSDVFLNCSKLTGIKVSSNNKNYSSQDGILFNKDITVLVICPAGKKINNYSIPDSVTSIEEFAFFECSGLTGSLTIPNSVTSIGDYAFTVCKSLTGSLTIPNSVTSIGKYAFYGCKSLTGNLTIPNSVTSIGDNAFEECSGLTGNLTIGNSVTSIGRFAFKNCSGLTGDLIIPNSVTSIGMSAFGYCSSLTGNLTISNSVTSISDNAFEECSGLTGSLTIPNSVTSIGDNAFENCKGLTGSLTIPDSVTSIGDNAFAGCSGLTGELTIPNSVTSLGRSAFFGCKGLTGKLIIPDGVTSIGDETFRYCKGLTGDLIIPNNVTSIGAFAFKDCNGLTGSLTIPDSVTSIGGSAFDGCKGLTGNLIIPNSVTSIGSWAFTNCNSLDKIIFCDSAPKLISNHEGKYDTFREYNKPIYYRKGTTGFTAENGWPIDQLVEYEIKLKENNVTINKNNETKNIEVLDFDKLNSDIFDGELTIEYTSENSKIAKVDETGNITTGGENGTTNINANIKYNDNVIVVLKESVTVDIKATNIKLDKISYIFNQKETLKLNATVLPENTNNKSVKWESSNEDIALVNQEGVVTPIGKGNCKIIVTTTDGTNLSANCNITSNVEVEFSESTYLFDYEATKTVNLPEIWKDLEVTEYSIDNTNIAFMVSGNLVGAKNKGTTTLRAKVKLPNGKLKEITANIEVDLKIKSIKPKEETLNFTEMKSKKIDLSITPANAGNKNMNWTSSNTKVATVSESGVVTPVGNGTCKITATTTDGTNLSVDVNVTVDIKATSITTNITNYIITSIHDSPILRATVLPSNTKNKTVKWSSSNTKVATVSESGVLKSVGNGNCTITATTTDGTNLSAVINITVDIKAESISLNKTSYTFDKSESLNLIATIKPDNTKNKKVTWTSSNTKVATVSNTGVVIPVGKGNCTITATTTDGTNRTVSCDITSNVEYVKGDINKDRRINMVDVYYGMKGMSKGTLTEEEILLGDVTNDGKFNMNDVNKLLRYIAGKIESLI